MTVLIRPAPARVAGNRVVPFRYVQYVNKVRPVGLRDWKPPVPEPLPPAPLLGLGSLGALGLQALAWWWGQLNSRPKPTTVDVPVPDMKVSGKVPPPGNTVGGPLTITTSPGSFQVKLSNCEPDKSTGSIDTGGTDTVANVTGVSFETASGKCGTNQILMRIKRAGQADLLNNVIATGYGFVSYNRPIAFGWSGPNAVDFGFPQSGGPLPDGYNPPEVDRETEVDPGKLAPPAPLPLPVTTPDLTPEQRPATSPGITPVEPGPVAPPVIRPALPPSPVRPKPGTSTGTSNGSIVKPAAPPVPVTDPGSLVPWPGAPAIPGTGVSPRPDLVGIAQEVGKIERKLEIMNTERPVAPDQPLDLVGIARAIYELLMGTLGAPTYTLDSPCEVDANGNKLPPIEVKVGPAFTAFGSIAQRVDALAELVQVHKNLKQPICEGNGFTGEEVTVNFVSTEDSPLGGTPLRKLLMYRDQTSSDVCMHANHWSGFSWSSGPVLVRSMGLPWGRMTVMALTVEEGKRVISHAAQVAGVDLNDPRHRWIVKTTNSPRIGVELMMVPQEDRWGAIRVSKRAGSSGPPQYPYA